MGVRSAGSGRVWCLVASVTALLFLGGGGVAALFSGGARRGSRLQGTRKALGTGPVGDESGEWVMVRSAVLGGV